MNFYCTAKHCSCMGIKQFSAGKAVRCTAESCKNKSEPSCGSCKWYAEPEDVCVNDQSEHVADFVWDERGCKEWEKKRMSNLGNALIVVLASFLVGTFICGIAYLIEKF